MGLDTRVTQAQAGRLVGVSRQLIRRWVKLGHLDLVDGLLRAGDVLQVEAEMRRKSGRPVRLAA